MTAPPKKKNVVTCETKRRYADEFAARAAAMESLELHPPESGALWIYPCALCRGWHLTRRNNGTARKIIPGEPVL